jgi:hypothetical protein
MPLNLIIPSVVKEFFLQLGPGLYVEYLTHDAAALD